jgi:23S rRNA pseudouridine2605 synthase
MEERLQKVIARAGVASRREAERLIEAGRVTVNGHVVREFGQKVDPRIDEVRVDTVALPRAAAMGDDRRTYLLLNKPKGVLCTVKDTHGRPTVLDLCPPFANKRLYPVGRLDEDSEGIVLLTNDGALTERLTHPRYGVPKVYEVRVVGRMHGDVVKKFEQGVWLSDGRTGRSRVRIVKRGGKVTQVHVTLTEGRNREIRRAFAKLDHPVLSLRRVQLGPIVARGLKVGQYRPLDDEEIAALHEASEGRGSSRPLRRRPGSGRRRPSDGPPSKRSGQRRGVGNPRPSRGRKPRA